MARPMNIKKSWYRVFIKPQGTQNILKKECEEKCDYVYVEAYTGMIAMSIVHQYVVEYDLDFIPMHFHLVKDGEIIDYGKTINQ